MTMVTAPHDEEPGFEAEVNELPDSNAGPEDTLEDGPASDDEKAAALEEVQEEAAEERKEGGYQ